MCKGSPLRVLYRNGLPLDKPLTPTPVCILAAENRSVQNDIFLYFWEALWYAGLRKNLPEAIPGTAGAGRIHIHRIAGSNHTFNRKQMTIASSERSDGYANTDHGISMPVLHGASAL